MTDERQIEINRNYDFFQRNLAKFLNAHAGEYALLRSGDAVSFHSGPGIAYRAGLALFPDEIFSVQKVTDEVEDLGFFSIAIA